jgi:hypothetical protein
MDIKVALGLGSVLLASTGYIIYIRDILRRKTKPHAYSHLVWSVIAVIGFGIQVQGKGGAGSWLLGLTTFGTLSVFALSLFYGHKEILVADKLSLFFALAALVIWIGTNRPLLAAVLITLIEGVGGFFPTFRKSYRNPHQETALTFFIYALSVSLSLLALDNFSLTIALYPVSVFFMNIILVSFLLIRRSQLKV